MKALEDPRWLALSEKRRNELLEEHRDVNVDYGWWSAVYVPFHERMQEFGFHVEDIFFSGFWCQGDGASFNGRVDDWAKFLTTLGRPELVAAIRHDDLPNLVVRTRGHYSHSGTMQLDEALELAAPEDFESLQLAAWEVLTEYGMVLVNMSDSMLKFLRGEADDLYRKLEEEHDYQTDDEQVAAWLLDNLPPDELAGPAEEDEEEEDDLEETPHLLVA